MGERLKKINKIIEGIASFEDFVNSKEEIQKEISSLERDMESLIVVPRRSVVLG